MFDAIVTYPPSSGLGVALKAVSVTAAAVEVVGWSRRKMVSARVAGQALAEKLG